MMGRGEQGEQLADLVLGLGRVPEVHFGVDLVDVSAPVAPPGDVAALLEVAHDALGGTFGDLGLGGQVPQALVGVRGDQQ